jgi:glycerol-3-phosphate dehydrogenase (NAD(P)+)
MRCAVIGAGAWGTALADLLAGNGHETVLWAFETDVAATINACAENKRFLSGLPISRGVRATNDYADAIQGAASSSTRRHRTICVESRGPAPVCRP